MGEYTISLGMCTIRCANCGIMFGVPREYDDARRRDGRGFMCPNEHSNVYRETEAKRIKKQLEETQRRLMKQQERAVHAEGRAEQLDRQYHRVRTRIMAGVCPCCNRTFPNVAAHMKSKHPEFSPGERLKTLREAFGLIQKALADEAGVSAAHVSLFENGKPVSELAERALNEWIDGQAQKASD